MRERVKRFALAATLTALDIAVAENFVGVIWQAWSEVLWIRQVILLLLGVWVASATVMWILVYYDLRQTLNDRRIVLSMGPSSMAGELGRDGDV
jgi:hypothetical protein